MSSTWGSNLKISIFGGSHTEAIGVVIDGLPAGETIDFDQILAQMARRAPGRDKSSTPRKESDRPKVLSGLLDGVLTGAPLAAVIQNNNTISKDYSELKVHPRPGHADYPASVRYNKANDIRGGGHFSGRLTACMVFAGAVCRQILEKRGIHIGGHVLSIGPVRDTPFDPVHVSPAELDRLAARYFPVIGEGVEEAMREEIETARMALDSIGGVVRRYRHARRYWLPHVRRGGKRAGLYHLRRPGGKGAGIRRRLWSGLPAGQPEQRPLLLR